MRALGRARASQRKPTEHAIGWLRAHESAHGGIFAHSETDLAYPEVTGYLIPTLLTLGERELALRAARWLVAIQRGDGGFTGLDGEHYVFDTAQALRGLLAVGDDVSGAVEGAERAAGYLLSQLVAGGVGGFRSRYDGVIVESVHLFALPPLREAGERFGLAGAVDAVERSVDWYATGDSAGSLGTLTHFLAYELEGLIELGRADLAEPTLAELARRQTPDGAVPAYDGVTWVCTPGLAQIAGCWLRLGRVEPAQRALAWLAAHQRTSGGLLGSYGRGAAYFAQQELAWAVKFFLDAEVLRDAVAPRPEGVGGTARAEVATFAAQLAGGGRVVELQGRSETLPYEDRSVDAVLSTDALERTLNIEATAAELLRVVRPGGAIVVAGPPLRTQRLESLLHPGCETVTTQGGVLSAVVRGSLSPVGWQEAMGSVDANRRSLVERIRENRRSEWALAVSSDTRHGDEVLEVGSGTGEISLQLAVAGRRVTLLDLSEGALAFARAAGADLGVEMRTVVADATAPLPFPDASFDCVWSSGVLEHFLFEQRAAIHTECARVSRRTVVSIVPNAASVAYRAGKDEQERQGLWPWGREDPLLSQRAEFEQAGIAVEREYTVGVRHALNFLRPRTGLRRALEGWIGGNPQLAEDAAQGYLLVTVGRVDA